MSKETNGYYIETANIHWLEKKAKEDGRSASNYLDRLLTGLREGDEKERPAGGGVGNTPQ